MRSYSRFDLIALALLLGIGLVQATLWRRTEFLYWDGSYYIGLAETILHSSSYQYNGGYHTLYPPGMPLVLAGVMAVFGEGYPPQMITIGLFGAFGLLLTYLVLRQMNGQYLALVACLFLALSTTYFRMNTFMVVSDTLYFFLSMACLLLVMKLDATNETRYRWARVAAVAGILPLPLLVRPIGVSLVAGMGLWLVYTYCREKEHFARRLDRFGWALLTAGIAQIGWTWYSKANEVADWPGQFLHSHFRQFLVRDMFRPELGHVNAQDLVLRLFENLRALGGSVTTVLTNQWIDPFLPSPAVVVPAILFLIGLGSTLWRRASSYPEWYLMMYLGILLFYPFPEGMERYLFPVIPLAVLYCWRGVEYLYAGLSGAQPHVLIALRGLTACLAVWSAGRYLWAVDGRGKQGLASLLFWAGLLMVSLVFLRTGRTYSLDRWRTAMHSVAAIVLLANFAYGIKVQSQIAASHLHPAPPARKAERDAGLWLKENTPPAAIVMAEQVPIIHRFSARRTIHFPITSKAELIKATMLKFDVAFLVVNDALQDFRYYPLEQERVEWVQQQYPDLLHLVAQTPGYRIFRVGSGEK